MPLLHRGVFELLRMRQGGNGAKGDLAESKLLRLGACEHSLPQAQLLRRRTEGLLRHDQIIVGMIEDVVLVPVRISKEIEMPPCRELVFGRAGGNLAEIDLRKEK